MSGYKDFGFYNDNVLYGFSYLKPAIVSLLNKDKNKIILDLGCGNGSWANFLISEGFNVYGIDASEKGIEIARRTNPDRFFIQDLSVDELPVELQNIEFDTIISTEVIEHLYDPEIFISFCKKVLKNKGEVILSTPYHGYLKNLSLSLFDKWDKHHHPLQTGGHIKFWSKLTLSRLLTDAGFTITDFKGCGRLPYLWKSMVIKARIG